MKPFVLRRLKCDVLKDLPEKTAEVISCSMTKDQEKKYKDLITLFSKQAVKVMLCMIDLVSLQPHSQATSNVDVCCIFYIQGTSR